MTRIRCQKGFTLIELMVVVVVIGILVAMGLGNFYRMRIHAQEASVKSNMHSLQVMIENFATINSGVYPLAADAATVRASFPGAVYPDNPFTHIPTPVIWNAAPANPGEIGLPSATLSGYTMVGYGGSALLSLILTNG